jgi:hypothetical protein
MNTKLGCWALIALTLLAGCVPSLNPLQGGLRVIFAWSGNRTQTQPGA